jgi:hypothetical protein
MKKTIKERKEEVDEMMSKLIKDYEREHRRPIDTTIIPKFYL